MNRFRAVLIGLAACLAALLVVAAVALNSSFQTWALGRALASRPGLGLHVGRVSAGVSQTVLTNVTYERSGLRLEAPSVEAKVGLFSLVFRRRLVMDDLVARGWTVTVDRRAWTTFRNRGAAEGTQAQPPSGTGATQPATAAPAAEPKGAPEFHGALSKMVLPVDLAVEHVELSGRIVLPGRRGAANVQVSGGGLGVGREGTFTISTEAALEDTAVSSFKSEMQVRIAMDTPRAFTRFQAVAQATASGGKLTRPVSLHAKVTVARSQAAEEYAVELRSADRLLLAGSAMVPPTAGTLTGNWTIDLNDADVAPFLLGRAIPAFNVQGRGSLDSDPSFLRVHSAAALTATVDRLDVWSRDLAVVGRVQVVADVDVTEQAEVLAVSKLNVAISSPAGDGSGSPAARPIARVQALQAFDFHPRARRVLATDPALGLVGIELQGLPLAWTKPFLRDVTVQGSDITGELIATPRAGGFSFRTKSPLSVTALTVSRAGQPVLRDVALSLRTSGDYTPLGWQAEVSGVTARAGAAKLVLLDAKAGQLAGANQPVKATGVMTVDLGAIAGQPVARDLLAVTAGEASVDFTASLGVTQQIEAKFTVKNLATGQSGSAALPTVDGSVRADISAERRVTFHMPLQIRREDRVSDLALRGTFTLPQPGGPFDVQVTSNQFVLDDARPLLAAIGGKTTADTGAVVPPVWAGLNGTFAVQVKKFIYTGMLEMANVTGSLHFSGGVLRFETLQGVIGTAGEAHAGGTLIYNATAAAPFSFGADVALTEFDPAPLFAVANPRQPPSVDGRFIVTGHLAGAAGTVPAIPFGAGRYELTSRGGVFRGLPVNVGNLVENSSKLMSWIASAGNAITSLAGRKEYDEVPSRSKAASELARLLSAIHYDQLNMIVLRDEHLDSTIQELTLISPEVRLRASGRAVHVAGQPTLEDPVTLDYQLRVRGRPAELMKYLGVLEDKPDDLGYAACTIPVRVQGTLAKLDTTELSNRLVALAVEKTGLTEKAVDWINRLRGKGTGQ